MMELQWIANFTQAGLKVQVHCLNKSQGDLLLQSVLIFVEDSHDITIVPLDCTLTSEERAHQGSGNCLLSVSDIESS